MNDLYVYIHWCGGYLRRGLWLYVMCRGDMGVVML